MNKTLHTTHYKTQTRDIVVTLSTSEGLVEIYNDINSGRVATREKIDTITKVFHPCIIIGKDGNGHLWVAHNHIDRGRPIFERLDSYSLGQKVIFDKRPVNYTPYQIVKRAIAEVQKGKKYHAINYNCQTFVNLIVADNHSSEAIDKLANIGMAAGAVTTLLGLVTKNKTLTGIGLGIAGISGGAKIYSKYDKNK